MEGTTRLRPELLPFTPSSCCIIPNLSSFLANVSSAFRRYLFPLWQEKPRVSKSMDPWTMPPATSDNGGMLWMRPEASAGVRSSHNSLFNDGSSLTEQSVRIRAGRKQRVAVSDDDSSKIVSACSGDDVV